MEKKKKEKEARFLQAAQNELSRVVRFVASTITFFKASLCSSFRCQSEHTNLRKLFPMCASCYFPELNTHDHTSLYPSQSDKIFLDFQDAYAANEDHIRKLWEEIAKEQLKLQVFLFFLFYSRPSRVLA